MHRSLCLPSLLVTLCCAAQNQPAPQQESSPQSKLREALAALHHAEQSAEDYTHLEDFRIEEWNRSQQQQLRKPHTYSYEVVYINGLKYEHLLRRDGKPLDGRALEQEEKRYEAAIQEKTAIEGASRARADGLRMVELGDNVDLALSDAYHLERLPDAGGLEQVLATPVSFQPAKNVCTWSFRFFIGLADGRLERIVSETVATEGLCEGEKVETTYKLFDGEPRVASSFSRFNSKVLFTSVTTVNERTMTGYQRFRTKSKLLPATVEPVNEP